MSKQFSPGQIVVILGGTYAGQGARVCKVDHEKQTAEVMIAGKVRKLKLERLAQPAKVAADD